MNKINLYLKIFGALVLAFVFSYGLNRGVFIADSPAVRTDLNQYLGEKFTDVFKNKEIASNQTTTLSSLQRGEAAAIAENELAAQSFSQLIRGVYSKENSKISYTIVKEGEVDWKIYDLNVNGKSIRLKTPANETPIDQNALAKIIK